MSRGRPTVLIVDDEPAQRSSILGLVENLGYEAVAVSSGAEALEALSEREFGAVLISASLPGPDGCEVTRRLRQREGTGRRTPVIGMAAAPLEPARERCLAAGMDDCVGKPLRLRDLGDRLFRWVVESDEPHAGSEEPLLDEETIGTLRQFDLLGQLLPSFIAALPEQVTALREALVAGDRPALRLRAHRLRGAAVQMGAAVLARVLGEIEVMAVSGADGRLAAVDAELGELVASTVDALTRASAVAR